MNFPPTIKEPKNTHALAATSAFNLKLCHSQSVVESHRVANPFKTNKCVTCIQTGQTFEDCHEI